METTFITIQDLTPDARILYCSDSIIDILGYSPDEVVNRSCWEFFHPEELPYAKAKHGRGIEMDKAAVLSYCRMKSKDGQWLGCEVVFTVVDDVLVGCASIYRRGLKSQSRAIEAPAVRRLFSNSPRDPRYHMMSHLSSKLYAPQPRPSLHEPRAALFVNRYTRTLTIMYATNGLADVLGITGEELKGRSFYYCIQENCLQDAVRCLENAKANDSIAYMRFWYRDPRTDDHRQDQPRVDYSGDIAMEDAPSSDEGISPELHSHDSFGVSENGPGSFTRSASDSNPSDSNTRESSRDSLKDSEEATSSDSATRQSPTSTSDSPSSASESRPSSPPVELEAVVSCTSDGLVVCLRKASPVQPTLVQQKPIQQTVQHPVEAGLDNGLFAVPWSNDPILPRIHHPTPPTQPANIAVQATRSDDVPLASQSRPNGGDFMASIKDIAVFAWGLVGINGTLTDYSRGQPRGESQPPAGLPIWQPVPVRPAVATDGSSLTSKQNGNGVEQTRSSGQTSSKSASPMTDSASSGQDSDRSKSRSTSAAPAMKMSYKVTATDSPMLNGNEKLDCQEQARGFGDYAQRWNLAEDGRQQSPSLDSHMVNGVGAFEGLHNANGKQRTSPREKSSSGFGFGDPGLSLNGLRN